MYKITWLWIFLPFHHPSNFQDFRKDNNATHISKYIYNITFNTLIYVAMGSTYTDTDIDQSRFLKNTEDSIYYKNSKGERSHLPTISASGMKTVALNSSFKSFCNI